MGKYITLYFFKSTYDEAFNDNKNTDYLERKLYSLIIPLKQLINLYDSLGKDTERLERFIYNDDDDDEEGFFIVFFKEFIKMILNTKINTREYDELIKFNKFFVNFINYNQNDISYHIYNIYDFYNDDEIKHIEWKERFKYLINGMNKNKKTFINEYNDFNRYLITHIKF